VVAANIPDLDVLVFLTDTSSVSFRRGWTHGILAQLVLPLAVTGIFWAADRLRPPRVPADALAKAAPPFHAGWMLLLGYIGVYSHVLLDLLNSYGVRLLTPFDWRWLYGDALFIIDPWLWLALGLGVWLSRRARRPAQGERRQRRDPQRPARAGLLIACGYIAAMIVSARASRSIVIDQWRDTHGSEPRAVMVAPRPLTPLTRDVIIDAGDHYEGGTFSWSTRAVAWDPGGQPKNDRVPEVAAVQHERRIREFLVWSRFPIWEVDRQPDLSRVVVRDMRFMAGGRVFAAEAVIKPR
jgi:inner membrane protein